MKQNESKRERFKCLTSLRTNAVIQRLKVLRNCANRQAYEYTEDEVKKICATIEEQMRIVRARFHLPNEKEFKL